MKTATSALAFKVVVSGSSLLITAAAAAQAVPPASQGGTSQPSTVQSPAPSTPSSNPWDSLPEMSADRCIAEAVGTASDPKTGAPVRASVDPQTGKPVCPPSEPSDSTKPPR